MTKLSPTATKKAMLIHDDVKAPLPLSSLSLQNTAF
jgi:hypothetical protein